MAKHMVKCAVCGKQFDLNSIQGVKYSSRRYAHQSCFPKGELVQMEVKQVDPDYIKLKDYINELFGTYADWPNIQKQIKKYLGEEYNFTYSGIQKSLEYFYIILKNDITKSNGQLGIVPYVYQKAYNYYYSLWVAKQLNEEKDINEYVPKEKIIYISNPERKIKKRKLFSFLDEEE